MDGEGMKINLMPPHPGSRTEILEEFDLARAAKILGVRRAALFRPPEREGEFVAGNDVQNREGFRRVDGCFATHGSML